MKKEEIVGWRSKEMECRPSVGPEGLAGWKARRQKGVSREAE